MDSPNETGSRRRFFGWLGLAVAAPFVYVLSSGPVLAVAFRLREDTGWDGFYAVMWLYYPLIVFRDSALGELFDRYVTWWCDLFQTVGPG